MVDAPGAKPLRVTKGEIRYEGVRFHYGRDSGLIENLSLTIRPGEKVGLVGPSGAGKSTLINILLRFHDLEAGRILIDGQDIAGGRAGQPARADRACDAGYVASAPLRHRQHPLRQAGG